jgi:hypothetical protein
VQPLYPWSAVQLALSSPLCNMKEFAPIEIDVRSLTTHQVTPVGSVICLNIENARGRPIALRLPRFCGGIEDFILTMRTSDGFEIAFTLSATTIARMMSARKGHSALIQKHRAILSALQRDDQA